MTSGKELIDIAKSKQSSNYHEIINNFVDYLSDSKIDCKVRAIELQKVLYSFQPSNIEMDFVSMLFETLLSMDLYERNKFDVMSVDGACVLECTGSGKKPIKTLNISTPSILIAVAAGAHIVKKGSHATSSLLGSADLLSHVGYKEPNNLDEQKKQLINTGFTFINIEKVIPKFNSIYSGFYYKPHILSYILGAYVTSLRGNKLIYGISCPECDYSAKLLSKIVTDSICTYCSTENGIDYFDELIGNNQLVCHVKKDGIQKEYFSHKLSVTDSLMQPFSKRKAVQEFLHLLCGFGAPQYTKVILYNSAFLLTEAGIVDNWEDGIELSRETLSKGSALYKLQEIVENSGGEFIAKI